MTVSLRAHDNSNYGNRVRRSMSSGDSTRQEVTEQMWHAAEDCSRSVQRRLEQLGRRRLRVGYGEQTVPETKRNADAFETPTLLDDDVCQRGLTVPGHEDICKRERPACNRVINHQLTSHLSKETLFNVVCWLRLKFFRLMANCTNHSCVDFFLANIK